MNKMQEENMVYDFDTLIDRNNSGSFKYMEWKNKFPNASEGIVPFTMADMEFKTAPEIAEALKAYIDQYPLGYAMVTEQYRTAFCNWMKERHGWEIDPEWILPMTGVLPGLYPAIQTLTKPGEGVIILTPVFGPFRGGIEVNDRAAVTCPLVHSGMDYSIDYETLEKEASRKDVTAILFCNPHNPVSRVWSLEELEKVAEICTRHDLYILSDEVHGDLLMPGFRQTSFGRVRPELTKKLVIFTAPTKTFNLAGLQVGNMIIRDEGIRNQVYRQMNAGGPFTVTSLGFVAAETAYTKCGSWLDACIRQIWENHQALKKFIREEIPQIIAYDMQATYLQWMDFRGLGLAHEEMCEKLYYEAEVFMDDGADFGTEGSGFWRMNIACPKHVMMDALLRLKKVFG